MTTIFLTYIHAIFTPFKRCPPKQEPGIYFLSFKDTLKVYECHL
jgi:hypothetical protein